ncbi:hypothetical protein Bcop_1638 [Bacteroides coprosuis DSM 18011]|uniref:Uncharacterized protein n=1 Tax=Bacteroides coprosuis DSM 18011 TaxID=679937 RepID=F3ZQN5_9BACE|nr:hypothetical protein Bcop_1638 [Bacteroides coprosuis DSM 18011]
MTFFDSLVITFVTLAAVGVVLYLINYYVKDDRASQKQGE